MKKREIIDFYIELSSELLRNGYATITLQSDKSNSIYISDVKNRFVVRVSDHGGRCTEYNFTPRKKGGVSVKDGCYTYFPMTNEGIELFIEILNKKFKET
jgi:hypothetical protein